jgi:hypothetical protein
MSDSASDIPVPVSKA